MFLFSLLSTFHISLFSDFDKQTLRLKSQSQTKHISTLATQTPISLLLFFKTVMSCAAYNDLPSRFSSNGQFVLHGVMKGSLQLIDKMKYLLILEIMCAIRASGVAKIVGGALRDTILHPLQVSINEKIQHTSTKHDLPNTAFVIPRDVDCRLVAPMGVEFRSASAWQTEMDKLVNFLKAKFGITNVTSGRLSQLSHSNDGNYTMTGAWLSFIHVAFPFLPSDCNVCIDVSAPMDAATLAANPSLLPYEDCLDLDVNGLIDGAPYDLHPMLCPRGSSPEQWDEALRKVLNAIQSKVFTVVAKPSRLASPYLWRRVLKRLRAGWVGKFAVCNGAQAVEWKYDAGLSRIVSEIGWKISETDFASSMALGYKIMPVGMQD
jgi:hypothetical protein